VTDDHRVALLDRQLVRREDQPVRLRDDGAFRGGYVARPVWRTRQGECGRRDDGDDDQERGDAVLDDPTPLARFVSPEGYGLIAGRSIVR